MKEVLSEIRKRDVPKKKKNESAGRETRMVPFRLLKKKLREGLQPEGDNGVRVGIDKVGGAKRP